MIRSRKRERFRRILLPGFEARQRAREQHRRELRQRYAGRYDYTPVVRFLSQRRGAA